MQYISRGDFIFPFDPYFYWVKQVFMWSYQSGSANPDGIIKLPSRLLNVLVFNLFGNITVSIFFLVSSLVFVYVSFFFFSKYFLKIEKTWVSLLAAAFFVFNPIFLGNVSKIGLVIAAGMLPLALLSVRLVFDKQDVRYFLLLFLALNISLIHPFTFSVNLTVVSVYFIFQFARETSFVIQNIGKLMLLGSIALLLNAYLILPIASLGSVSKDVLSSNVSSMPTDYTSLIGIANTGDIFTGLTMSKHVFKDYEFYSPTYQLFFIVGSFGLYLSLFGTYVYFEKRMSREDKSKFLIALISFLILLLLATVNLFHVKDVIKTVIGLPGGWMFRSPLKWQLYIPITVAVMLAMSFKNLHAKKQLLIVGGATLLSFVLMNAYISLDISHKLLTPKKVTTFSALASIDLNQKNVLIINDPVCFSFASTHYDTMTELNQIFISRNVQVKQTSVSDAQYLNIASYDYVLDCQKVGRSTVRPYGFMQKYTFANNAFQLYVNPRPRPYIYDVSNPVLINSDNTIADKYAIARSILHDNPDFVTEFKHPELAYTIQNPFENITFENVQNSKVTQAVYINKSSENYLYTQSNNAIYMRDVNNKIILDTHAVPGSEAVRQNVLILLKSTGYVPVEFGEGNINSNNLIANGSLEKGLWQSKVGDCYAYGDEKKIDMKLVNQNVAEGNKALQLSAENHLACTGPQPSVVQAEKNYMLGFAYKTVEGRSAAYYLSYDDKAHTTIFERLPETKNKWETYAKIFKVPAGARHLKLTVYAYPKSSGIEAGISQYDNIKIAQVPEVNNRFYIVGKPTQSKSISEPKRITYKVVNPTKTIIHITGTTSRFILGTKESFSPKWQLNGAPNEHLRMNGAMNAWLVDLPKKCEANCKLNSDGSYSFDLVMEFKPQRAFYLGAFISAFTLLGVIAYVAGRSIFKRKRPIYKVGKRVSKRMV